MLPLSFRHHRFVFLINSFRHLQHSCWTWNSLHQWIRYTLFLCFLRFSYSLFRKNVRYLRMTSRNRLSLSLSLLRARGLPGCSQAFLPYDNCDMGARQVISFSGRNLSIKFDFYQSFSPRIEPLTESDFFVLRPLPSPTIFNSRPARGSHPEPNHRVAYTAPSPHRSRTHTR